jgi:DNA repair exonuclease SbcCD nuclease subunit
MADIHFDSPFRVLTDKKDFGTKRRLEQREAFRKAIEYISKEEIPYLFIAGDLYDQNYIKESTIEFINNLFKTIPDTKIFISPGNHDPFLKNSFYNIFKWNDNVTIFNEKIKRIELDDVDIYGYGFNDFYCSNSKVEEIQIKNKEKINILLVHGALDSSKTIDTQYNPISTTKLKEIGFDYIALGHIHKKTDKNKYNFIYPGSMISFGFDELGEHGMLEIKIEKNNNLNNLEENKININNYSNNLEENKKNKNNYLKNKNNYLKNKNKTKISFVKLDNRVFEEKKLDVSEINSEEEMIEKINCIETDENNFYKIVLIGRRNIEINTNILCKLIVKNNILKIEDKTETKYDFDKLVEQNNLKGIFVKKMIQKLNDENFKEEEIIKAIETGLKAFE